MFGGMLCEVREGRGWEPFRLIRLLLSVGSFLSSGSGMYLLPRCSLIRVEVHGLSKVVKSFMKSGEF